LTHAQLEELVDSRLESTEEEYARAHVELCSQCSRELDDLQEFSESRHHRRQFAAAASARPSFWEVIRRWFQVPRHALATTAAAIAVAAFVGVLVKMHAPTSGQPLVATTTAPARPHVTSSPAVAPSAEVAVAPPKPEAVLPSPSKAQGARGARQMRSGTRVLSEAETYGYREELAKAPDDPEARAAIAITYGLYGEAEKEYLKMEATGGKQAERAHALLERLRRLRALAEK
jgi:hypothetical protein